MARTVPHLGRSPQIGALSALSKAGAVRLFTGFEPGRKIVWSGARSKTLNNWPALVEAVQGNIIADFPVINKSFNLSYSGTDR